MHNFAHFQLGLAEPSVATFTMLVSSQHALANPASADRLSVIRLHIHPGAVVGYRCRRGPIAHEQPRRQELRVGWQVRYDLGGSQRGQTRTGSLALVA